MVIASHATGVLQSLSWVATSFALVTTLTVLVTLLRGWLGSDRHAMRRGRLADVLAVLLLGAAAHSRRQAPPAAAREPAEGDDPEG